MTSIDTNVLIALWDPASGLMQQAASAVSSAGKKGPLFVSGPVLAELLGFPGRNRREILQRLKMERIQADWSFGEADWEAAGVAYQGYVLRRRLSGSGLPRLILTDFLIGAHASVRGCRLLTLDKGIYKAAFPLLHVDTF